MMLSTLVLALALPLARAGKFDKYTSCEMCIEAGWGWNTVWGTGSNDKGQLGDGTATDRNVFVKAKAILG